MAAACERSLKRLKTDRIDLYLLHWRGSHPLAETVAAFEALRAGRENPLLGRIELRRRGHGGSRPGCPAGAACAANQVLYHPDSRGIEFDLLPWCARHGVPIMAYSPLGHDVRPVAALPRIARGGRSAGRTPAQVAIAWGLRSGIVISIPKAADPAHVRENAGGRGVGTDR